MTWLYNGLPFSENLIDGQYGFIYKIRNHLTGKLYIGKKLFWFKSSKQVKGKKKKILIESDWRKYWGSNKVLLEDINQLGVENFTREILHLCPSKGECNYWEVYEILNTHALRQPNLYYNEWIAIKVSRSHLKLNF